LSNIGKFRSPQFSVRPQTVIDWPHLNQCQRRQSGANSVSEANVTGAGTYDSDTDLHSGLDDPRHHRRLESCCVLNAEEKIAIDYPKRYSNCRMSRLACQLTQGADDKTKKVVEK
jgi:hypothetical protein